MEAFSLRRLTYVSRATQSFDRLAITVLGQESSIFNAIDGVTGRLLYNGHSFFQTIEGAVSAIDDLMVRLRRDPRHHALQVTSDNHDCPTRHFGSWNMDAVTVGDQAEDLSLEYYVANVGPDKLFWDHE